MNNEPLRPLTIRGRVMGLRPVWPEDFLPLFEWLSDKDESPLWTSQFRQATTFQQSLPQLEAWVRDSITMIKIDQATGERFGFARAYNVNLVDGYLWIQAYTTPPYRLRRHGAESAVLFSRYLFEQFPIRKICSEVFEFNEVAQRLNEKLGFKFEGRIRDHTWYRDRYWDHLLYSLSRENWAEAMDRYGFIVGVESELAEQLGQGRPAETTR